MLLKIFTIFLFQSPFIDLVQDKKETPKKTIVSPFQMAALWLVALHQNHLTHIDGPRSHFLPCSSSYMKQALTRYGFFKGSLLGLDRLLRENSQGWVYDRQTINEDTYIKLDPVR